jgi:hypothetical protein
LSYSRRQALFSRILYGLYDETDIYKDQSEGK